MGVLKTTMKCALDRGTKPDVLINVAVEGNYFSSLKNHTFNVNIVAFKNQNQPSKAIVPAEKPVIGNAIEDGSKPDKSAIGAVEGNTISTLSSTPFNFNIAAVVNQNAPLKQAQTTDKPPPRKKQKIATKEEQRVNFSWLGGDTSDQSDSSGMVPSLYRGECITNSLQIRHQAQMSQWPNATSWEARDPSQSHKAKLRLKKQNEELIHNLEDGRAFQRRRI